MVGVRPFDIAQDKLEARGTSKKISRFKSFNEPAMSFTEGSKFKVQGLTAVQVQGSKVQGPTQFFQSFQRFQPFHLSGCEIVGRFGLTACIGAK
jgi:hypothetical protein